MKRIFANLLGNWTDITDEGTVERYERPTDYFKEGLYYEETSKVAKCNEYDYINVQYKGNNYRIHPSMIQIVTKV